MSWGRVVVLDFKLGAEILELRIVELFPGEYLHVLLQKMDERASDAFR